mmetsp:Transcript_60918/g.104957  ORF Transcript_60918/g.104957 Transcript_60918/m.104957 type:complete len:241 (+) Transcript_60918:114-836(+)
MGALELSTLNNSQNEWSSHDITLVESYAAIVGSLVYIFAAAYKERSFDWMHCYSRREQQHVTLMSLIFLCGAMGRNLAKNKNVEAHLPMVIFAVSFAFFVGQHEQPNEIGYLMHFGCGAFMILHAIARTMNRRLAAATFIYVAGILFFYSQFGIVVYLKDIVEEDVHPTAVLLGTVSFALELVYCYITFFPQYNEENIDARQLQENHKYKMVSSVLDGKFEKQTEDTRFIEQEMTPPDFV